MTTKNSAKSVWETLSEIDVSAHLEQKGKFSYVSWAWAWALVKQKYPLATFKKSKRLTNKSKIISIINVLILFLLTVETRKSLYLLGNQSLLLYLKWITRLSVSYRNITKVILTRLRQTWPKTSEVINGS